MPIVKTKAIVLKTDNYRETSRIVTLFTQSHGKIRTIAKGVRDTKSRWGGVLQSMAYIEAMVYYKENRTLHLLSGADYVNSFSLIHENNKKIEIGYRMIELVNKVTLENHENRTLFDLIIGVLQNLNDATKNFVNLLFNYEFKLAKILGFEVNIDSMKQLYYTNTNKSIDSNFHNLYNYKSDSQEDRKFENSKVFDKPKKSILPGEAMYNILRSGNFEEVTGFNILKPSVAALDNFFEKYFEDHIESFNFSKTKRVFSLKEMKL